MSDMKLALRVLRKTNLVSNNNIAIYPYVNGRENGFMCWYTRTDKAVAFSEHRNSDEIVLYRGKYTGLTGGDFEHGTHIPSDKVYKNRHGFNQYTELSVAIEQIREWLFG